MKRLKDIFHIFHILGCVSFHSPPPPTPPPKSRVFPEPVTNGYGTEFKFKILKLASLIGSTLILMRIQCGQTMRKIHIIGQVYL